MAVIIKWKVLFVYKKCYFTCNFFNYEDQPLQLCGVLEHPCLTKAEPTMRDYIPRQNYLLQNRIFQCRCIGPNIGEGQYIAGLHIRSNLIDDNSSLLNNPDVDLRGYIES